MDLNFNATTHSDDVNVNTLDPVNDSNEVSDRALTEREHDPDSSDEGLPSAGNAVEEEARGLFKPSADSKWATRIKGMFKNSKKEKQRLALYLELNKHIHPLLSVKFKNVGGEMMKAVPRKFKTVKLEDVKV